MHLCCLSGDLDTAELLVELGADANAVDKEGDCPLAYAQDSSFHALVAFLQAGGAVRNLEEIEARRKLRQDRRPQLLSGGVPVEGLGGGGGTPPERKNGK